MNTIYFDFPATDQMRRQHLYDGDLFILPPCENSLALCEFAQDMIQEEFGSLDPRKAQYI